MGIVTVWAEKFLLKTIYEWILWRSPKKSVDLKVESNDEALLLIMMVVLVVYGMITHTSWARRAGRCFIAGMSFVGTDSQYYKGHTYRR